MIKTTNMSSDTIPRTANLLPCKQWWKVCFLYGDQEKYYRQVYGKAASQRLAMSQNKNIINFPTKEKMEIEPKRKTKNMSFDKSRKISPPTSGDELQINSRVTILDDPFLFGKDDVDLSNDSGITESITDSFIPNNELCKEFELSESELRNLHLSRGRRGFSGINKNTRSPCGLIDDLTAKE